MSPQIHGLHLPATMDGLSAGLSPRAGARPCPFLTRFCAQPRALPAKPARDFPGKISCNARMMQALSRPVSGREPVQDSPGIRTGNPAWEAETDRPESSLVPCLHKLQGKMLPSCDFCHTIRNFILATADCRLIREKSVFIIGTSCRGFCSGSEF